MTSSEAIGEDVHKIFLQLTGLSKVAELERLLQSPFTLHQRLLVMIDAETASAQRGEPARIIAKMNSLTEPEIIRALYRASQAGVRVDLIVRGICCLRPGVPGVSDNVHVRSIVGRFLEHSRIAWFRAGGEGVVLLGSADWMERNLHRRVETVFPIDDAALKAEVLRDGLETYLEDDTQAWILRADGEYVKCEPAGVPHVAQTILRERLSGLGGRKPDPSGDADTGAESDRKVG
jgi:polyphosphate kinase